MACQSFENLEVWKKASLLKKEVNDVAKTFPADEKYRLFNQVIRSSRSVNTQIAKGDGRHIYHGRIKFGIIAMDSLTETLNYLISAFNGKYINKQMPCNVRAKLKEVERLLIGYIGYH